MSDASLLVCKLFEIDQGAEGSAFLDDLSIAIPEQRL